MKKEKFTVFIIQNVHHMHCHYYRFAWILMATELSWMFQADLYMTSTNVLQSWKTTTAFIAHLKQKYLPHTDQCDLNYLSKVKAWRGFWAASFSWKHLCKLCDLKMDPVIWNEHEIRFLCTNRVKLVWHLDINQHLTIAKC